MRSRSSVARSRETSTAVLFARAWRHCHGTDPRLAALPGHQCAQQRLAVDRIRLGAPVASRHGNRRRIDDVALDPVGLEQAMNPETIEFNFVDRHNLDRRCNALLGSGFGCARRSSSLRPSPPTSVCFDIFLLPGASDVATHVERRVLTRRTKWHSLPGSPRNRKSGSVMHRSLLRLSGGRC